MKAIKSLLFVLLITAAFTVKADVKTAFNVVVQNYLEIKNALAADNSKAANEAAKKFTDALKNIPAAALSASQKSAWEKYREQLRYDGEHIGESTSIDHQREHFGKLSNTFYALLKAFKQNEQPLFQQYCPMVKQYWLSESATIKNPYLGKKMIDCGETKETLKAGTAGK